jgi:hypothetical protein
MTAERKFADAESLTPVMWEVFGTDRRIAAVDRLLNGTKKGVYRVTLDDATSTIVYVWNADEDYWDGLLPDGHDDPSNPFAHASGIDFFEGATRRLEAVGARSPRLLLADRSKDLYPADIAVAEDVRGGTLEALLERDPDAGRQTLAQLSDMLRRMHAYRAPAFGRVAWIDGGGAPPDTTCEQAYLERALVNIATAVPPRLAASHRRGGIRLDGPGGEVTRHVPGGGVGVVRGFVQVGQGEACRELAADLPGE